MRKTLLLVLISLWCIHSNAQIFDSINTATGPLYFNLYGKGKAVLLLSGGPGLPAQMLEPMAVALRKNFQAVLLEQRGTGRSIPKPFDSTSINLTRATDDINLLKEKLGVNQIIIIGHSFGATLALYYATKYPQYVEKLVLVPAPQLEPGASFATDNRIARSSVAEREAAKRIDDSLKSGIATPGTLERSTKLYLRSVIYDAYKTDSLYTLLSKGGPINGKMSQLMTRDVTKNYHLRTVISSLMVPTLAICGRQDPFTTFTAFELGERNKNIAIHWINKSGHYPFVEQPEEFYSILIPFLNQR